MEFADLDVEVQVRVIRRPGTTDEHGRPDEIELYASTRDVSLFSGDNVNDIMDSLKRPLEDAITRDNDEEQQSIIASQHEDDESNRAKDYYYAQKEAKE